MSLEFRTFNSSEEDEYAECAYCDHSGRNVTTMHVNRCVRIHLCEDCLKALRKDIDEQLAGVSRWCVKCRHFEPNEYGAFRYGGHCKFEPPSHDCHNHDATCDKFEALENENS